jgi:glutamine cyclotransferase
MSDGTHRLFYIDPSTLKTVKTLEVSWNNVLVDSLNELEFVKGYIYANRYTHNYILKMI